MNKNMARISAVENEKTWGELNQMVEDCKGSRTESNINRNMSLEMSLGIMSESIATRNFSDIPDTVRTLEGGLSIQGVTVMNIYRECA